MSNPLAIGIVGLGRMGEFHLKKILENKLFHCVGVFDPVKDRRIQISNDYKIPAKNSLEELLSEVQGLFIVSPSPTHFSVAKIALEADLHLFIEKPITVNVSDAKELLALAAKKNKVIQVGFVERFRLKKFLEKVSLPQNISYIEAKRLTPRMGRDRDTGAILDLMIHDIDLVDIVVPEWPKKIEAISKKFINQTEDWALATLEFSNGVKASIECFRFSSELRRTLRIVGEDKEILFDFQNNKVLERVYDKQETAIFSVEADALTLEHNDFYEAVVKSRPAFASGEKGLKALDLTHQVLELCQQKY